MHGEFTTLRLQCYFSDDLSLAQLTEIVELLVPPYVSVFGRYFDRLGQDRVVEANLVDFNCDGAFDVVSGRGKSFLHIGYRPKDRLLAVKFYLHTNPHTVDRTYPVDF